MPTIKSIQFPAGLEAVESLPHGLEVTEDSSPSVVAKVCLVRDVRLGDGRPPRKIARTLSGGENVPWKAPLIARLSKLASLHLLHVSLPLESWEMADGSVVIVSTLHRPSLAERTGAEKGAGLTIEQLDELIHQMLTGLSELHRNGLSHGDLRPHNVFLESNDDQRTCVWIADAAIGPLTWFSDGEIRDPESRFYYPPEWNGQTKAPSPQADLYALGATIVETVLGRLANPARHNDVAEERYGAAEPVLQQLTLASTSRAAGQLVRRLLHVEGAERFSDAGAALRWWNDLQNGHRWAKWRWPVVMVVAFIVVALAAGSSVNQWIGKSRVDAENARLREELTVTVRMAEDLKSNQSQIADLKREWGARLDAIVSQLKTHDERGKPPQEPESAEEKTRRADEQALRLAQALWEESLRPGSDEKGLTWDRLHEQLRAVTKRLPKDESSKHVVGWYKDAAKLLAMPHADIWFNHDREFSSLATEAMRQPWNVAPADASERVKQLERAAEKWKLWAYNSKLAWVGLGTELLIAPEAQQPILRDWLNQTDLASRRPWTVSLVSGKSADWGVQRRVYFYGPIETATAWHAWSKPTQHSYGPNDQLQVTCPPGEGLRVMVESGRIWMRAGTYLPNIIDESFDGPLPLWKANYQGKAQSEKNEVRFKILNCPGPPPAVFVPSPVSAAKGVLSAPRKTAPKK